MLAITDDAQSARVRLVRDTVLQLLDAHTDRRSQSRRCRTTVLRDVDRRGISLRSVELRSLRWQVNPMHTTAASDQIALHCGQVSSGNLDLVRRSALLERSWYSRDITRNHSWRWCIANECDDRFRVRLYASRHK